MVGDRDLVILGIRPEHFEDATLVDAAKRRLRRTFRPRSTSTEWLGNEQYAYIPYEAAASSRPSCTSWSASSTASGCAASSSWRWTGQPDRGPGATGRALVRPGRMHLFDPVERRA